MLDPQSWLDAAQELPLGGRRRVNHDCGDGRTLIVAHTDAGWNAYCWRCSDKGFKPLPQPSLAERISRLASIRQVEEEAQATPALPGPANYDSSTWPLPARVWLYKAGLSNDSIRTHGVYFCGRLDRVVLPVSVEGRVVYWQARGFDRGRPKYLNPAVDRTALAPLYGASGAVPLLVLTEDLLSAYRVAEYAPARSLMGTAMSDRVLQLVEAHRLPVSVWLDPDGPGRRAATKVAKALRAYGIDTRVIRTELDPKCYSREEIAAILQ